jgi:hypothetical protein
MCAFEHIVFHQHRFEWDPDFRLKALDEPDLAAVWESL